MSNTLNGLWKSGDCLLRIEITSKWRHDNGTFNHCEFQAEVVTGELVVGNGLEMMFTPVMPKRDAILTVNYMETWYYTDGSVSRRSFRGFTQLFIAGSIDIHWKVPITMDMDTWSG